MLFERINNSIAQRITMRQFHDRTLQLYSKICGYGRSIFTGKTIIYLETQKRRKSRKNVRNLIIFEQNSYQAEVKLSAKFRGYLSENYRDLDSRFKGALTAARLSAIESLCD
jgi:hypothetical protein